MLKFLIYNFFMWLKFFSWNCYGTLIKPSRFHDFSSNFKKKDEKMKYQVWDFHQWKIDLMNWFCYWKSMIAYSHVRHLIIFFFKLDLDLRDVCHWMEQERGLASRPSFASLEAVHHFVRGFCNYNKVWDRSAQQDSRVLLWEHELSQVF